MIASGTDQERRSSRGGYSNDRHGTGREPRTGLPGTADVAGFCGSRAPHLHVRLRRDAEGAEAYL